MTPIQKVITIAENEVGYREKATNTDLDSKAGNAGSGNYTKYARDLDALGNFYNGPKQGYAYCDVFFDWLFFKAFGAALAKRILYQPDYSAGAGCLYSAQYYENNGAFYSTPAVGDQIFFSYRAGEVSHTGLVIAVDSYSVTTIEGNTSDGVYKRSYSRSNSSIYGYGRPNYALAADSAQEATTGEETAQAIIIPAATETPTQAQSVKHYAVSLPLLKKGSYGETVKAAQAILILSGFSCGGYMIGYRERPDGDFGNATFTAVKAFQLSAGLEVDGEIGGDTWAALLGV